MAVISQNQSNYLNGLLKGGGGNAAWAQAQLQGSSVMPQADPALVAQHQAAADQFRANNWKNGTANGQTESQNLANVINQPGNTVQNNLTPYLSNVLAQAGRDNAAQQPQQNQPVVSAPQTNYSGGQSNYGMSQGQSATDLINSIYQSQLAAQQQANKQNRDNLLAGISGQDALAHQSATQNLNNNDVMSTQNGRKINEMLANQGVQGGDSITANIANQTAQGQNANLINQNLTNSLNGNLAQRNAINNNANASDLAIMQNLQGQQSSNLLNDLYKSRDFGIQQGTLTGQYNGQNTMQQNQNNFTNGINQGTLTGYYNGPQGQQQNGYGQNNNQQVNASGYGQNNQGYGQNQNNGQNWLGQNGNQYSGNNQQGNGFQSGMGALTQNTNQGIRTLQGQTLDQKSRQDNITNALDLSKEFGIAVNPKSGANELFDQVAGQRSVTLQQLDEKGKEFADTNKLDWAKLSVEQKRVLGELAIGQQNANSSSLNASTSSRNADLASANAYGTKDANGNQTIDFQNKTQDNLYKIWNDSGKAPEGIPGVDKGTPLFSATVQQQQLANAYKTWNETGVAPIGIPNVAPGTPKYNAVDARHQGMNTSESGYITQLDTVPKANIKAALEAHKAAITKDVGVAGYTKIYNTYFDSFGNPK